MKYVKLKRNLENYTVRDIPESVLTVDEKGEKVINTSSDKYYYGQIPDYKIDSNGDFLLDNSGLKIENTIDFNVFLTQSIDDMGMFTNVAYEEKDPLLTQKPSDFNPFTSGRLAGAPVSFYYTPSVVVSGQTDDGKLKQLATKRRDMNNDPIYVPGLNFSKNPKKFKDAVIFENSDEIKYKIGALKNTINDQTLFFKTGVNFITKKNEFINTKNIYGEDIVYRKTYFSARNGGMNETNTSLSALLKQEEYLGIVFKPEINSDVFINRGAADIFERHAILSEIKTTNDIDAFRGGWLSVE